jgi:hypothetical protein
MTKDKLTVTYSLDSARNILISQAKLTDPNVKQFFDELNRRPYGAKLLLIQDLKDNTAQLQLELTGPDHDPHND